MSGVLHLAHRVLVAATVAGLLVQDPSRALTLIDPAGGRARPSGIPQYAILAGADAGRVAWQPASCTTHCPLYVTSLRGGRVTKIGLPPHTALNPGDTPDFDPADQRLALPLDTIDQQGGTTGTNVYVADLSARTMVRVPGQPIPVATLRRARSVPGRLQRRRLRALGGGWLRTVGRGDRRALLPGCLLDRHRPAPRTADPDRAGVQIRPRRGQHT